MKRIVTLHFNTVVGHIFCRNMDNLHSFLFCCLTQDLHHLDNAAWTIAPFAPPTYATESNEVAIPTLRIFAPWTKD